MTVLQDKDVNPEKILADMAAEEAAKAEKQKAAAAPVVEKPTETEAATEVEPAAETEAPVEDQAKDTPAPEKTEETKAPETSEEA